MHSISSLSKLLILFIETLPQVSQDCLWLSVEPKSDLVLPILLAQLPKSCSYEHAPPGLVYMVLDIKLEASG